ncbi:disulfide bond formation protein B [Virgibacillus dakarensis]|uniref:Probable disulfide formation protein n=1 Tax=Lentibacillus populi TaxID=1827502 RepID=A0A9W5TZM1_9BACI|nr:MULTISPECIES: disulfide oxidoreductase [Bacillaceae]MBT2215342.1 disulfide bond formation protein B [Virgibacillus dakarensis]MTW85490.1 disulfide bond formation protein B [Virgibacillus dakarensis]GGB51706.1 putative disulfide formation protein C [Lentibacillus populi]
MENSKSSETILLIIWGQAVIALAGSLFYSEVMGYVPCEFCWYQRILMYPLVIIYGAAAIKKDLSIALPGLILSGIGIFVSIYHYLIQKLPALQETGGSCGVIPCNTEYVNYLGFITIPFLAGVAFIVIFVLHMILLKQQRGK